MLDLHTNGGIFYRIPGQTTKVQQVFFPVVNCLAELFSNFPTKLPCWMSLKLEYCDSPVPFDLDQF